MVDEVSLPESLKPLLRDEIASGERLVWVGAPQPEPGLAWRMTWPIVAFCIPSTAFMLFWVWTASGLGRGNGPPNTFNLIFAALGLPPLVLEAIGLTSPIWMARRLQRTASNTLYVVTDRRAIIFNGGYYGNRRLTAFALSMANFFKSGTHVKSYAPEQITDLERVQHDNGSGDLVFGAAEIVGKQNDQPIPFRMGFFTISNVHEAGRVLRKLVDSQASGALST